MGVVVERRKERGRARLDVLASHGAGEIGPFVRGAIDKLRAALHSDGLVAYEALGWQGIRHAYTVQGPHCDWAVKRFPWSHVILSNLKSWLRRTFYGVSPAYLVHYLDEFTFRYNHRSRAPKIGTLLPRRALRADPTPLIRLRVEPTARPQARLTEIVFRGSRPTREAGDGEDAELEH